MSCKNCDQLISTQLGCRPVHLCRHLLCETCAADLKCPICGVSTEESLDSVIDQEVLSILKREEALSEANSSTESFLYHKCVKHPEKDIEFACILHEDLLCAPCAWPHICGHREYLLPYTREKLDADLVKFTDIAKKVENDCMDLQKSISKVKMSKPEEKDMFKLLYKCWMFANKVDEASADAGIHLPDTAKLFFDSTIAVSCSLQKSVRSLFAPFGQSLRLELLYRASRDGDTLESFQTHCANKGATLMLITAKKMIFGAFIESSWIKSFDGVPGNAGNFIFSLNPLQKLHNDPSKIACRTYYAISVGNNDLCIPNNFLSKSSSEPNPGNAYGVYETEKLKFFQNLGEFKVTEMEVFSIK